MSQQPTTAKNGHPSGDNRFKLLDRAITKNHSRGDALIEVLHAAQGIFGFLENDLLGVYLPVAETSAQHGVWRCNVLSFLQIEAERASIRLFCAWELLVM